MSLNFKISYRDIYLAVWSSCWSVGQIWLREMLHMVQFFFPVGGVGCFTTVQVSETYQYILLCLVTTPALNMSMQKRSPSPVDLCAWSRHREQITSPYQHNSMGDIFLISLCWLLLFFFYLHLDQWQIFWEDRWGRCQQTGILLHNSLYLSCFLDEESWCVTTSIRQAFSIHCICPCCFSSFFVLLLFLWITGENNHPSWKP